MSTVTQQISAPMMEVPIRVDQHGDWRVGDTRVLVDTIINAHRLGQTPQGIVESFPSVTIKEVYAVLAWYLNNQELVDAYMARREKEGEELRRMIEATQGTWEDFKAKLLARRAEKGSP